MGTRAYLTLKRGKEYRTIWVGCDGMGIGERVAEMTDPEFNSLWKIIGLYAGRVILNSLNSNKSYEHDIKSPYSTCDRHEPLAFNMGWGTDQFHLDDTNSVVSELVFMPKSPNDLYNRKTMPKQPHGVPDYAVAFMFNLDSRTLYCAPVGDFNFIRVPKKYMEHPYRYYAPRLFKMDTNLTTECTYVIA